MRTTREKAREDLHDERVDRLQDLLKKNYDAEAGYKKAMQSVESDNLVTFLKRRAAQRGQFTNELNQEILNLNAIPVDSGSTAAGLHRAWMDVKKFITTRDNEAILEECIRGEKASIKEYEKTLAEQSFLPRTKGLLTRQLNDIRSSLKEVEELEEVQEMNRHTSGTLK